MKKKVGVGISIFLLGLIVVVAITLFLLNKYKDQAVSQNPNVAFSASECDKNIDPYAEDFKNPITSRWEDNKLVIGGIVSTNCASSVTNLDYKVEGELLKLSYDVSKCDPCARCMCAKNLEVKISGLEKKNYKVVFE
ncbi:hypothetical protein KBD45_05055 [Candidatus Dojkabacteria bacterium]|nr:hypothetical protein [Candidatus Dojkabacteria bacterium]